jgi:hypothetical protein
MPEPILLPELARSLRTFGAPRGAGGEAAHSAIFGPLLDARARAGLGDVESALSALRGETLAVRISARASEAASAGQTDAAQARARAARAGELMEPLRAELSRLDSLAAAARGKSPESEEWRAWVAQLRRVFASADDVCRALDRMLSAVPADVKPARRWFRR